jgi:hypothetical protein
MKCFHNETLFTSELVHRNLNSLGRRGRDRMVVTVMDLQLPMPSVPITTGFVSSNPAQARCTRYNIMR